MTYDELLEVCKDGIHETNNTFVARALLEVVKLHQEADGYCVGCIADDYWNQAYPCQTIRAIERVVNG
jgi:hypothetical protein